MCFYCGKPGHFQKNWRHLKRDKGNDDSVEPNKISDERNANEEGIVLHQRTSYFESCKC